MIFRTSVSDEKHAAMRQSQRSESTHADDITLLEDQEQHLEAQPSLTGKYVNQTARSWVEARVDWKLQWFGGLVIYVIVVLAAYFSSYRAQYNTIILTTSSKDLEFPGGIQNNSAIPLPHILLLAETTTFTFPQQAFIAPSAGITQNPNTAAAGYVSWCNLTSYPQPLYVGPYPSSFLKFEGCSLNSTSQSILMIVEFFGDGPAPQLMIGAFPHTQSEVDVLYSIDSGTHPNLNALSYLPTDSDAHVSISPSVLVSLGGHLSTTYDLDVQWIPRLFDDEDGGDPPGGDNFSTTTASLTSPTVTAVTSSQSTSQSFPITSVYTSPGTSPSSPGMTIYSTADGVTSTALPDPTSTFTSESSQPTATPSTFRQFLRVITPESHPFTAYSSVSPPNHPDRNHYAHRDVTYEGKPKSTGSGHDRGQIKSYWSHPSREQQAQTHDPSDPETLGPHSLHTLLSHPSFSDDNDSHQTGHSPQRKRLALRQDHRRPIQSRGVRYKMSILLKYKSLDQIVYTQTRKMSGVDIFFQCLALLSVLLFAAEIIGRIGSWWKRRRMSKRYHLD